MAGVHVPIVCWLEGFRDRSIFGEKATRICSWGRHCMLLGLFAWPSEMRHVEDWAAALKGKVLLYNLTALSTDFGRFCMSSSENYISFVSFDSESHFQTCAPRTLVQEVPIDVPIIQAATKLCNARLIRIDNNRGGALKVNFLKASIAKWKFLFMMNHHSIKNWVGPYQRTPK